MRIGISVFSRAAQSIREYGLGQNVIFLARLFSKLAFVEEVVLLDCDDRGHLPDQVRASGFLPWRLVCPRDATGLLDVVVEMGGALDPEWLDYERALGTRVVFHCCGQPYVGLAEPYVFSRGGPSARAACCDAVWILPKDRRFTSMLQALHNCPVSEVPYLWSPEYINSKIQELVAGGRTFGYQAPEPGALLKRLRVSIFEPNMSVVKAGVIPMLITDMAFRVDAQAVSEMHVLNSAHMTDHLSFNYLSNSLDIVKADRACFTTGHDFPDYMAHHADAVVSHQWANDQNYEYLEALYGGYPLIHNSRWLGDGVGYYYPDFDVAAGADRLLWAAHHHHENLKEYRMRAAQFISRLSPDAAANLDRYARMLLDLVSTPTRQTWTTERV
jgi:hypothetical protein